MAPSYDTSYICQQSPRYPHHARRHRDAPQAVMCSGALTSQPFSLKIYGGLKGVDAEELARGHKLGRHSPARAPDV